MKDNNLSIGQKIYFSYNIDIPTKKYIVKRGDTLYSIAKENNTTIEEIKNINNLNSNILIINQEIKIPESKKETISEDDIYDTYIVSKGDSIYGIAKKFNININDLIKINNLDDLTIQINQKLLVPKLNSNEEIYIVEKGDTLWSVAKKNNIDVQTLKQINNLETNLLSIGQELKIK